MDFRTLVSKKLKCTFEPLVKAEEDAITLVIKSSESINRVIGKDVGFHLSASYLYYIAICHRLQ